MRNSRRNIADPISPQNPVIKKDVIENDRTQDQLEDKISVEDILENDEDENGRIDTTKKDPFKGNNDNNPEDES
jgi:hypothetical protein